jgi:hypothetical protein
MQDIINQDRTDHQQSSMHDSSNRAAITTQRCCFVHISGSKLMLHHDQMHHPLLQQAEEAERSLCHNKQRKQHSACFASRLNGCAGTPADTAVYELPPHTTM